MVDRNWHWHDMECDNIVHATRLDGKPLSERRRLEEERGGDSFSRQEEWVTEEDDGGDGGWKEDDGWNHGQSTNKEKPSQDDEPRRRKHPFPHYHPDSTIVTDADGYGWAHRYALLYIFYLCGEDCAARYEMGMGGGPDSEEHQVILDQLEEQAANNLRQSFAVVGLLHETDTFYDMLTARVQYLDMSLNPDIEGELHETGTNGYMAKCKSTFADPSFQQAMRQASPAVAALERLYKVAVEVNRYQVRELAESPKVDPTVRERLQKAAQRFE